MTTDKDSKELMEWAKTNVCSGMHTCPRGRFNSKDAKCLECLADSTKAVRQMTGDNLKEVPNELAKTQNDRV